MTAARVRIGDTLDGRYRLDAVAGRGGVGVVHRATDTATGSPVQVTVLYARVRAVLDPDGPERVLGALSGVRTPGLAVPTAVAASGGTAYLVTEPVTGRSLAAHLAEAPVDERIAAALGARLAGALDALHERGLVHRLLRPSSIALGEHDGSPVLTEVGVGDLLRPQYVTAFERLVGTAAYVSPEHVWNEPVGPAADVYALGLVLIEALTGEPAFAGTSAADAVQRTLTAPAVPTGIDAGLAALLAGMTAFRPEERPGAAEVAAALTRLALAETLPAAEPEVMAEPEAAQVAMAESDPEPEPAPEPVVAAAPALVTAATKELPRPAVARPAVARRVHTRGPRRRRLTAVAVAVVGAALLAGGSGQGRLVADPGATSSAASTLIGTPSSGSRVLLGADSATPEPTATARPVHHRSAASQARPSAAPTASAAPAAGSASSSSSEAPATSDPSAPPEPAPARTSKPTRTPTPTPTPTRSHTAAPTPAPSATVTPKPVPTSTAAPVPPAPSPSATP